MINKLEITGIHTDASADIKKYVTKKIAKLDGYMPRHARKSAHADIKLKEEKAKDKKQATCEVILYLPGETITAKETSLNMYAAIDIVEQKLRVQLKRYKDKSLPKKAKSEKKVRKFLAKLVPKKSEL
jgi:putative sigma-54 modulation protein